ncbi:ATP-binding protein [Streptococcus suis]|uniref:ATP-binding protein n=1 Tax=Streptococcus suis TaxID=1307 RepID=UPI000CF6EBD4|nr:ATP-binding protein [Streptococcus suis]
MEKSLKEVNLTIDPRVISHLGEALIDNEKIALLELIKNASDADANTCNIVIDTLFQSEYGQGRIVIEDDGNGMTPTIIEKAFLKIATSFKAEHQKISPKFKRQAQGNKGIGRLSLNQLGRYVSVDTKVDTGLTEFFSEKDIIDVFGYQNHSEFINDNDWYYYHLDIDWERYNIGSESVEDVKLELQTNLFNETVFSHTKKHGTRIEVLGLKGIDFWQSNQTQKEIEQDVLEFLNPFLEEKYNFYVKINLDNRVFTSNKYDLSDIENNFLSKVDFDYDSETEILKLIVTRSRKYIDYKVTNLFSELEKWELEQITEIPYRDYYEEWCKKEIEIDLSSFDEANRTAQNIKFEQFITYELDSSESEKKITKFFLPGSFRGSIYGFDLSTNSPVSKNFRKVLEEIRGVKLYRNNFRIFPYGNKNNDWLEMSGFNLRNAPVIYKQHTSTGFINIDGEENLERLKELTNRQGLVLDNYGTNFLLIVRELVYKIIAKDDRYFGDYFNFTRKTVKNLNSGEIIDIAGINFQKKIDEIAEAEKKADSLATNFDMLTDAEKKAELASIKESVENVSKTVANREQQVIELEKHFGDFAPIMGATIVAETLAHEIIRLSNTIKFSSSKARHAVLGGHTEEVLTNLSRIDSSNKFLLRYASLLDVNSYSRRRRYTIESVRDKLEGILKESPLLTYGNTTIEYKIIGKDFDVRIIEESFKIIVENMLINSTYWLDKNRVNSPHIIFELDNELGKLTIFDNGMGVDKSVENHLFEEFVTNKPAEDGRGMGLYIVTTLLNEIGATIKLDRERNQYDNLFKFVITFPNEEV